MDEVKEMLKAVINGQHALRREIFAKFSGFEKKVENNFKVVNNRFEEINTRFEEVNTRLDKQGKLLAFLEDDAPTREEHDNLENKVKKIEKQLKN